MVCAQRACGKSDDCRRSRLGRRKANNWQETLQDLDICYQPLIIAGAATTLRILDSAPEDSGTKRLQAVHLDFRTWDARRDCKVALW